MHLPVSLPHRSHALNLMYAEARHSPKLDRPQKTATQMMHAARKSNVADVSLVLWKQWPVTTRISAVASSARATQSSASGCLSDQSTCAKQCSSTVEKHAASSMVRFEQRADFDGRTMQITWSQRVAAISADKSKFACAGQPENGSLHVGGCHAGYHITRADLLIR